MTNQLRVEPGTSLRGILRMPGDKSITHRALIIGALSNAPKVILHNWLQSHDCFATMRALQAMGVQFDFISTTSMQINSVGLHGLQAPRHALNVGNSGTAIRLLTGVLAAQQFSSVITGDASICKRPMRRIIAPLTQMGARITAISNEFAPLTITGAQTLCAINYEMPIASSQVKSALLLASLYATGQSKISAPQTCRNHTELMLHYFKAVTRGAPIELDIPGDLSAAAFFIVAATVTPGSDLLIENVGINSTRTGVIEILQRMGANIMLYKQRLIHGEVRADIHITSVKKLTAITIPIDLIANAIDELPILAIAAACAQGTTLIRGASELRFKESDRIAMLTRGLRGLGILVSDFSDGMAITGGIISGGTVASGGDHRIAMAFAIAGLMAQGAVIIEDTENIATSFPSFITVARHAGMKISEESLCPS